MLTRIFIVSICLLIPVCVLAQTEQGLSIKERYVDSIKRSTYPYTFPAWGQKIAKKGIALPLPAGVMANYFAGSQQINISDLQVGFNGGPLVPLDFIKFGQVKANFQSVSTRVDLWVLPFVNVYGIFGETFASTNVNISAPFTFSSEAKFKGPTTGVGISVGGAVRGMFFIADYNNTWSFLDKIEGAVYTQSVSPRLGRAFSFKDHPYRNVTFWVGASGIFINRTTQGTINLSDLNPSISQQTLDDIKNETAAWFQTLTPAQKIVTKQIAQAISDKFAGLDVKDATISYSLIKRATSHFSMLTGGQFQLNPRWQFRSEVGYLGGRSSFLGSVNYRFGL
jgi:hypothetical protein